MKKRRSGIMFTVHRYLISYVPKLILLNHTWAAQGSQWHSATFSFGSVIILHLDEIAFRFPSHYRKLFFPAGLFPERFSLQFSWWRNINYTLTAWNSWLPYQAARITTPIENFRSIFAAVKWFRWNRKDFRAEIQFLWGIYKLLSGGRSSVMLFVFVRR